MSNRGSWAMTNNGVITMMINILMDIFMVDRVGESVHGWLARLADSETGHRQAALNGTAWRQGYNSWSCSWFEYYATRDYVTSDYVVRCYASDAMSDYTISDYAIIVYVITH